METKYALTFYDFIDHPLSALERPDADFVTSMRIWAKGAMANRCPLRLVAPRFVLTGNAQALVPFHSFMMTLGQCAARAIGLSAAEDGRVTEDEALILTALAAGKSNNAQGVRLAIASLVHAERLDTLTHRILLL